jgi:DNA mismatch repair ATPase MutS
MKPFLLYEQNDGKMRKKVANKTELLQDLNLHIIFKAMAQNDNFLYNTVESVMLNSLTETSTILYRQNMLKDCMDHQSTIHQFYVIASMALKEAAYYREFNQPSYARIVPASERVQKSLGLLELLIVKLEELKALSGLTAQAFQSKGLITFCSRQAALITDEFLMKVKEHIEDLQLLSKDGKIVISSKAGQGMKGNDHILRKITNSPSVTSSKKVLRKTTESNIIYLDNISIANSAREIADAGLIHILRVINLFTESILGFFEELRYEIGFYVGCINLYHVLSEIDVSVCFPIPEDFNKEALVFDGLCDPSMAISERKRLVNNDLDASGKRLLIITGANQGGKSTFLRSIGVSQIFMQCGLFVPASFYRANVCENIYTHFTREEDACMNSGKLDEELLRMNNIINDITPNSLLLMNESFAATTERDGSKIAGDIITALYELDIKVLYVTHLFEFSNNIYNLDLEKAIFLRAERSDNGSRSYIIKSGEPLQTSYGEDLFKSVMDSGFTGGMVCTR